MNAIRVAAAAAALAVPAALPLTAQADEPMALSIGRAGAYLGAAVEDVKGEESAAKATAGVVVRKVVDDSPAAKAGLQDGDVIVSFDGEHVRGAAQFARLVRETPVGRTARLEVRRDGTAQSLSVTVAERQPFAGAGAMAKGDFAKGFPKDLTKDLEESFRHGGHVFQKDFDVLRDRDRPRKLGIEFQEISGQLAAYFGIDGDALLVTSVAEDGPAARAGIKAGDVLLSVGERKLRRSEDLFAALAPLERGVEVALTVQRTGKPMDLKLTTGGESKATASKRPTL